MIVVLYWGAKGRWFDPSLPDHQKQALTLDFQESFDSVFNRSLVASYHSRFGRVSRGGYMSQSINKAVITRLNHITRGSKSVQKWLQCNDGIRRQIIRPDGSRTFQRLPKKLYDHLSYKEISELVLRLNHQEGQAGLDLVLLKSSFISKEILLQFEKKLEIEIPSFANNRYIYLYVLNHFIMFFLDKDPDPLVWHKKHQEAWGKYLLETKLSPDILKKIVNSANRFMRFLHGQRYKEIPLLEFKPISKATFLMLRAKRKLAKIKIRQYMTEKDFIAIQPHLPNELRSLFFLYYYYGLRRSEAIGLYGQLENVKQGYLYIDRQAISFTNNEIKTGPVKNRKPRKVNHWFITPAQCHAYIKTIKPMSRHSASKIFKELVDKLFAQGMISTPYVLHDLRHTWVSNAVKIYSINDVCCAAGHSDISVTNEYLKDTRDLSDEVWKP